jgi:hypothetical protein
VIIYVFLIYICVDEIEIQIKMGNSGHFAECLHSAKYEESLPSVNTWQTLKNLCRVFTLGKDNFFTEC